MADLPPTLKNLRNRTIIPRIRGPTPQLRQNLQFAAARTARFKAEDSFRAEEDLPDPANVQGDVYILFPKVAESFLFFWIDDAAKFKAALKQYNPTSSKEVTDNLVTISAAKERGEIANVVQSQIGFSRAGLNKLGWSDSVGDERFDGGSMRRDKPILGDGRQWDAIFDSGTVHGVFVIAAPDAKQRSQKSRDIKGIFGEGVSKFRNIDADRRPGENKGHEHFGYKDGVSQPSIRGLTEPRTGQLQCDPGVIIMGYKGDSVFDSTDPKVAKRPAWTKDGSLMVFRKLEQDVKGFEDYCKQNSDRWKGFWPPGTVGKDLTPQEGADLWGARMIGRWKSGCPVALSPYRDSTSIADDPDKVNNFDYTVENQTGPSDIRCPFVAHTRKTAPRNLDPYVDKKFLESALVVRGGMPYGKEYKDAPTDPNRGLAFVCYSSSITNGFFRQTTEFAGNNYFPSTSLIPTRHGQDPILGGPGDIFDVNLQGKSSIQPSQDDNDIVPGKEVTLRVTSKAGETLRVTGVAKREEVTTFKEDFFVTSRGGEYFFVPSIPTIQQIANGSPGGGGTTSKALDIVFLQDATGSQGPYIDSARDGIVNICNKLLASNKIDKDKLRFGLVAFRDYEPEDYSMLTETHDFTPNVNIIKSKLADLIPKGGGDGPEAQTAAMGDALKMPWREDAHKVVVLITDAPPHAIGESGDGFPQGTPDKQDPIKHTKDMAQKGIVLHVITCEPTLTKEYKYASSFYRARAQVTGGRVLPLSDASKLPDYILGSALETVALNGVLSNVKARITTNLMANRMSVHECADRLCKELNDDNVQIDCLHINDSYVDSDETRRNIDIWSTADSLDDARSKIKSADNTTLKTASTRSSADAAVKVAPIQRDHAMRMIMQTYASIQ
ncbi:hypothetical protein QCA50_015221 [Cerrena zonata]|uniref:VWFA domain-containing protein n=1 Tax=Cerrena zonata TaxID=2478898 RepID=A0AAW0FRH4_9APHY